MAAAHTLSDVRSMQDAIVAWIDEADVFARKSPSASRKAVECLTRLVARMEEALEHTDAASVRSREEIVRIAARTCDIAESLNTVMKSATGRTIRRKLEDSHCRLEDIAETAALRSSEKFERLVDSEIQRFFNGQANACRDSCFPETIGQIVQERPNPAESRH